ncbi:hypothetical protein T07_2207 [Trichinella nelsoni]|uniref:Uncharacterized protein n=1 Tax=Trichinella nelsoni TaxID=6336 RepID=A0A0V0RDY6_9BILA|nr:hypothetical protein T07_2207 [Trichinella nelsoni]
MNICKSDCGALFHEKFTFGMVQTGPTCHLLVAVRAILLGRQIVVLLCNKLMRHAVECVMLLCSCSTIKVIALLGFICLEWLWQSKETNGNLEKMSRNDTAEMEIIFLAKEGSSGFVINRAILYDHSTLKALHSA